jgi:AraC-like DNA-binding protein
MPIARPQADHAAGDVRTLARIVPTLARALLGLVEDRGLSAEKLCRGLGFTYQDLEHDILLSHQQTRALILRAQRMLGEPALGLVVGARETPLSWGLPGLALLTCETLEEAITYGVKHQGHAGSLLVHRIGGDDKLVHLIAASTVFDVQIEPFLVEESFASFVAIVRNLMGSSFKPVQVEFAFPHEEHGPLYRRYFRCPVYFDAAAHRLTLESRWMSARLPGYDRVTCSLIRSQLNQLLQVPIGQNDLVESLSNRLRYSLEERSLQSELAAQVNVSERTLRRRLGQQDTGFRTLLDNARYERSRDLLANTKLSIAAIAEAVGYSDARAFRRAFKRWSGLLPTQLREDGDA